MKRQSHVKRRILSAVTAVAGFGMLAACSSDVKSTYDVKMAVATPAAALQFENINPVVQMATAYGDKSVGEHGTFGKFPVNFITPYHTHTGAYHGVVVKGIMTNPFEGEVSPPEMPAGSYWYVPAGSEHATACISETPCEFYFHAEQAFDFKPVE